MTAESLVVCGGGGDFDESRCGVRCFVILKYCSVFYTSVILGIYYYRERYINKFSVKYERQRNILSVSANTRFLIHSSTE